MYQKQKGHGHNGSVDPELIRQLSERVNFMYDLKLKKITAKDNFEKKESEKPKRKPPVRKPKTRIQTAPPSPEPVRSAPVAEPERPQYRFNFKR
jgi:hypothetical protein